VDEAVEVVGEGKGSWTAFSLIYPQFARGRCNEGLKPADFAKAIMFWTSHLSVVDGKSPSLIVFCAPLTSGSLGRGGGGAWAVAEGKRIEANFLHGSHQWTKRLSFY
jgi:hypothetical protein